MKRRNSLFAAARRRRNGLGRFVLAWFAVAWFTLAGAPCLAMANADVDAGEHAAETHAHAHHGHAMSHGEGAPAVGHDHASTQKGPAHCPHCPPSAALPSHAPSTDHSFCSAYDEVADQTCFAPPSFTKHVVLAPAFAVPPPLKFHPPPRSSPRATGTQRSTIALNLRNCVLLI